MRRRGSKMKDKDSKIIKRLLSYAKPYKWWFLLVFSFMIASTAAELARPIIIGNAVDLFMEGYKIPFVEVGEDEGQIIEFEGKRLGRISEN